MDSRSPVTAVVSVALERPNFRMVISSETTASKEELTAHRSNKHPKLRIV
jgi:hypothetical protein